MNLMNFDPSQIGNVVGGALAGIAVAATTGYTLFLNMKRKLAESKVEIAEAHAARGAADADNKVYSRIAQELDRLADRVKELDGELMSVRQELAEARQREHQLELRLAQLDGFIRSKGLEPPSVSWNSPVGPHSPAVPSSPSVL